MGEKRDVLLELRAPFTSLSQAQEACDAGTAVLLFPRVTYRAVGYKSGASGAAGECLTVGDPCIVKIAATNTHNCSRHPVVDSQVRRQ
jgi:hypothetical protein